jgi:hypothetical protein
MGLPAILDTRGTLNSESAGDDSARQSDCGVDDQTAALLRDVMELSPVGEGVQVDTKVARFLCRKGVFPSSAQCHQPKGA